MITGASAVRTVLGSLLGPLGRKVVGAQHRRRLLRFEPDGTDIKLPRSARTEAAGSYAIWHGVDYNDRIIVGPIVAQDRKHVRRRVITGTLPCSPSSGELTGHLHRHPGELGLRWESVKIPVRDGGELPAWFIPGDRETSPWVVHVQGIRTTKAVTLRSVEAAHRVGLSSLVITYRGAGDGPPQEASTLGQREWTDVTDAIQYAAAHGAKGSVVVGWSMGAGIALEAARLEGEDVVGLALICPATNWAKIIAHGARRAGLPGAVGRLVAWCLTTAEGSKAAGLSEPLDLARLDWSRPGAVKVPTLVIHSEGDDEIPFALSQEFAAAHPSTVRLARTAPAPHGREANVDPDSFYGELEAFLRSLLSLLTGGDTPPESPKVTT